MRSLFAFVIVSMLAAPALAVAEGEKPGKGAAKSAEQVFKARDKDSDGKLSKDEFVGKSDGPAKEKRTAQFEKLDTDSSGSLSFEEFKTGFDAQKGGGKKKDKDAAAA